MNTLHFKYAVEVERTRSITQAAENLFMGQPNLSKAIKELEENLGFPIFERTSKGVRPTLKGSEFLKIAKSVLFQIEKMEALSDFANDDIQSFNVSIPRGSYISSAITGFVSELDQDKGINLNIQETNSMQTITNVSEGTFNLGIVRYANEYENYFLDYIKSKNLSFEQIWESEFLLLMSEKHPLAEVENLESSDLLEYTEIMHGDLFVPYLTNVSTRSDMSKKTKKIYVYERAGQFDILNEIKGTYMWVSPIPKKMLSLYKLVQRRCEDSKNMFTDLLIFTKGYKMTDFDKKFIDKVYQSKNQVAFEEYK